MEVIYKDLTCLLVRDSDSFIKLRFQDGHAFWLWRELGVDNPAQKADCAEQRESKCTHYDYSQSAERFSSPLPGTYSFWRVRSPTLY